MNTNSLSNRMLRRILTLWLVLPIGPVVHAQTGACIVEDPGHREWQVEFERITNGSTTSYQASAHEYGTGRTLTFSPAAVRDDGMLQLATETCRTEFRNSHYSGCAHLFLNPQRTTLTMEFRNREESWENERIIHRSMPSDGCASAPPAARTVRNTDGFRIPGVSYESGPFW